MKTDRKRHVSFVLVREGPPVGEKQLSNALRHALLSLYGEVAVAYSRLFVDRYDETTGEGILQCSATIIPNLLTAACLIESIGESQVSFSPQLSSGTIKSLQRRSRSRS
jgi:RNase P/RNase MRP subunit POP5